MAANSALSRVMDQAQKAAADAAETPDENTGTALATQSPSNTGLATTRPSLETMADAAGITVDYYLAVKETGLRIDKNAVFQSAKVRIDMAEVVPILQVRVNKGGSTNFLKSYDGERTNQGQSFEQATQNAQRSGAIVTGPYQTAEIPATLLENVPGAAEGEVLGITPPLTGVKFWTKFYKQCRAQGLHMATVDVQIDCLPQSNKNGNEWGVVGFTLLGESDIAE